MRDVLFMLDQLLSDYNPELHFEVLCNFKENKIETNNILYKMYQYVSCYHSTNDKKFLEIYYKHKTDFLCNELEDKINGTYKIAEPTKRD